MEWGRSRPGGKCPMIMKIRKRDGSVVPFNQDKITDAIWKAAKAVGGKDKERAKELSNIRLKEILKIITKRKESLLFNM